MAVLSADAQFDLERKYDHELRVRLLPGRWDKGLGFFLFLFALYHYVTAGAGIPADYWHMGIHLAGVLAFVFILYPARWSDDYFKIAKAPTVFDLILVVLSIATSLYIGVAWLGLQINIFGWSYEIASQAMRQGNPNAIDLTFGTILLVLLFEAARRTLGIVLPLVIVTFAAFAIFGPLIPVATLKHPGLDWAQFVNNMYFPAEGIFGITLWVASTIVFHFVLFGVVAQRTGLSQFFIDLATVLAGRYSGGPAKVSAVSSAFFGSISGSAVANTVSTGSLTIPNMKRLGYKPHFAGAVEAASSAGGQITPPIMGAAAFIMAEALQLPYATIAVAAIFPALMHYVGLLLIVHFEAKKLGLKRTPKEEIPQLFAVIRAGWTNLIPLILLCYVLFSGYTPYMAAFIGISSAIVIAALRKSNRLRPGELFVIFKSATQYALAVGVACAAVGIVVGVVTTTGVAFRLGYLVATFAQLVGGSLFDLLSFLPFVTLQLDAISLFFSLIFIAIACIFMGMGLPTAACYVVLSTVAQPALANFGIPPLATHLFVLYYGVLSEITPPVCTSAYAAAGIARSDPFKTGMTAFSMGGAKLLMPMVFVYSPGLLFVLDVEISATLLLADAVTCIAGMWALAVAQTGYFTKSINLLRRILFGVIGLLFLVPVINCDVVALVILAILAFETLIIKKDASNDYKTS